MADIFISYASIDRPTARRLADALKAHGWSVWWDHQSLRGGQHFDRIIEETISTAGVVIVVWSQNSVKSDWVRAEAAYALENKKLAPLRIDMVPLPLRFKNIHTIDLSSWTGQTEVEPFEKLIETLGDYLGASSSSIKSEQPGTRAEPSSQSEPTDGARRFYIGGNHRIMETVPSTGPPGASPNSGLFPASVATEHRASTGELTFSASRKKAGDLGVVDRVGRYLAAFVITGSVLVGVVALVGRQQPQPTKPLTEATFPKTTVSTSERSEQARQQSDQVACKRSNGITEKTTREDCLNFYGMIVSDDQVACKRSNGITEKTTREDCLNFYGKVLD